MTRTRRHDTNPAAQSTPAASEEAELARIVGTNLRRVRLARGLSLERLAQLSGVSRGMLSQMELSRSTPTINVLWKISSGLGLPFSALATRDPGPSPLAIVRSGESVLAEGEGGFRSRALFPLGERQEAELYEVRLAAGRAHGSEALPPGTTENLAVHSGAVEIDVEGDLTLLRDGDAITFAADRWHAYRNVGAVEAVVYLVIIYRAAPAFDAVF